MTPLHPSPLAGDLQTPTSQILCSYRNPTNRMVVVRARGVESFFLERVVFPLEIMTFHCPLDGEVEVVVPTANGHELCERQAAEHFLAVESGMESKGDWRPLRHPRPMNVRSNASSICIEGL
ncbi:MAG: DUF1830 domain-containing protein [Cyanobacteriota bacterium]|nr:DUF1830 domain-containing protein [Cyanobacteriota bacterium]